jgi:cytochrome oxidase Cu insertion factor (SCO1/SenC/PrrC family)
VIARLRVLGAAAVLLTTLALAPAGAAPDFASMQVQAYDPPKDAPALSLPDLQGRTQTLADRRGHVVLLFFWATW